MPCCDPEKMKADARLAADAMRADPAKFAAFKADIERRIRHHMNQAKQLRSLLDFSDAMEKGVTGP